MIQRIVIATHNRKKAGEMTTILSRRFPTVEFLTLADFDEAAEPEETGSTYEENALIKARSAFEFTGEWCIADDAGLEIDALDGAPGLFSKRFGGEDMPFPEKMARIKELMAGVENRGARFQCFVAVMGKNPEGGVITKVFSATCEGKIADDLSGTGGFGYDPIFFLPQLGCTMADLTADQKHEISHRGKVLKLVGDFLSPLI